MHLLSRKLREGSKIQRNTHHVKFKKRQNEVVVIEVRAVVTSAGAVCDGGGTGENFLGRQK